MNKLTVINENGEQEDIEVLDFYQLEDYDHEYVLYTKGEEVDKDNMFTYLAIITQESENEFKFKKITDPEEERKVEELMNREIEELMSHK